MRYLLFTTLLLSTLTTNAQVKFEVGPALGIDYGKGNSMVTNYSPEYHLAANPALLLGVNINNKVGIHSGFQYTTEVFELNSIWWDYSGYNMTVENVIYRDRRFAIPVNVSYNFLKKDNKLTAGLIVLSDISVLLGYKYKTTDVYYNVRSGYESDLRNNTPLLERDFNWNAGGGIFVGYNFSKHINGTFTPYFKTEINLDVATYRSFGCTYNLIYRF